MARCMSPACNNYRKELRPNDIQEIKGRRVCAECWGPIEEDAAVPAAEPAQDQPPAHPATISDVPQPTATAASAWPRPISAQPAPPAGTEGLAESPLPELLGYFDPTPTRAPEPPLPSAPAAPLASPETNDSDDIGDGFTIIPTNISFPTLVIYQGGRPRSASLEVRGDIFLIGRSSSNLLDQLDLDFAPLTDGTRVSRRHARIIQQDGRYYIEDLHSSRGTWVDDERVPPGGLLPLSHGAWINIAEIAELQFLLPGGA